MTQNEKLLAIELLEYAMVIDEVDEEVYRTSADQTFTDYVDSAMDVLNSMFTNEEIEDIKGIDYE